jgi:malate permease and related proteins
MTSMMLLERIFLTVFPLVAIVSIGYFYAKRRHVDMSTANAINIDVFIPALLFSVLSAKSFEFVSYGYLALGAFVVVIGSGIILYPLCRALRLNTKTFLPPMMFNNSGNLGLPLAVLAFGKDALPAAVVLFIVENLLHFTLGIYMLNRKTNPFSILKMPMIIATFAGLAWSFFQLPVYPAVRTTIDMLGQIAIPLMLFALGVRMTSVNLTHWKIAILGAVLCPLSGLLMALAIMQVLPLEPLHKSYLLLFAVLPPAVLNYMVSERFQQEPQQVAAIVLIANMVSLIVIPLTLWFIL